VCVCVRVCGACARVCVWCVCVCVWCMCVGACVCVCIIPSFHTLVRDLGGLWRRDAPSAQTLASTMATMFCRCGSSKHNNRLRLQGMVLHFIEYSTDFNMGPRGIRHEYITQGGKPNSLNVEIPIRHS